MRWSVSMGRTFQQCPRKWFYQTTFADGKSADPLKREADILSQLNNIHSWRGKLVDSVITDYVVPHLNNHDPPSLESILSYTHWLSEQQIELARSKAYRNDGAVQRGQTCAFFELEYGGIISDESLRVAKTEVRESLTNLYDSKLFDDILKHGLKLIAQRPLQFQYAGVTVTCMPDLIAFFEDREPAIVDWKVEAPKYKEHWIQLGTYGVALSRVNPHSDFPSRWHEAIRDPTRIRLVEFQLLRSKQQEYAIKPEDIVELEDYIYSSVAGMQRLLNGSKPASMAPEMFPTAKSAETCLHCNFRKICWREEPA